MIHFLLAAGLESAEHADAGMFHALGIYPSGLISQIIVFLILGWLLNKYAFAPVLAILDERRRTIEKAQQDARRIEQELAQAEATRAEIIKKANEQANALIEEARASAEKIGQLKIQEAVQQAEAILKKATEAAAREREQVLAQVRQELGQLVVTTTAKVIGKTLTRDDQARLQKEALSQLG
jgi:F-type H+-transporting ATPase subunit b